MDSNNPCAVPPAGWYCTRPAGHQGPCAARPTEPKPFTLFNRTTIRLSGRDALRALLGKPVHLHTDIDVSAEVQVLATRQQCYTEPLFTLWGGPNYALSTGVPDSPHFNQLQPDGPQH